MKEKMEGKKEEHMGGKHKGGKHMGMGKKEHGFGSKMGKMGKGKMNMEGPH